MAAPAPSVVLSPATCNADSLKQFDVDKLSAAAVSDICTPGGGFLRSTAKVCPGAMVDVIAPRKTLCDRESLSADEAKLLARLQLLVDSQRQLGRVSVAANAAGISDQGVTTPASVFAQGVGDFLTSRAEQEVSAYATVELFNRICSSDDVGFALPATCQLLKEQDEGASPMGLGTLRRVVESDLRKLPQGLIVHELKVAKTQPQKNAVCAGDVAFGIANAVRLKLDIGQILAQGKLREYATPKKETTACDQIWKKVDGAFSTISNPLQGSANGWGIAGIAGGGLAAADVPLAEAALELAKAIQDLLAEKDAERAKELRLTVVAKSAAVVILVVPGHDELVAEASDVAGPLWNKDWSGAAAALATAQNLGQAILCGGEAKECKTDKQVRLVIGLAADIADAKESAAVQAALNRIAEPIGSWRRKGQDSFTLSLNGYAGVKGGAEWNKGVAANGGYLAPMLPIGVDLAWRAGSGHLGMFFQVVDVGNVASVHLAPKEESGLTKVEADPDLTVLQLFAPGAYVMWAPVKSPFVIGVGASWVPSLRQTADGGRHSAFQVGGTLAVDVPILELVHH